MLCLHVALCGLPYESHARAQDTIGQPIVEVLVEQEGQVLVDPLISGLIETTVGEPLSMRDVRESIEHLMNLRRFEDVRPTAEAVPGGVRVRYVLLPLHPVDRVEFRGNLGVSERDLRRLITDRFGRAPAAGRADDAAETLRQHYRDRGYPGARVTTRLEETHNPDRATLLFEIDAGRRARIADVRLLQVDTDAGDVVIGTPDLRAGDPYDAEQVNDRLRAWEDTLKARGYYEARASHGADILDDAAYLRVNIRRGPRVVLAFEGDSLPANDRTRLVPIQAEGSADEDLLEDAKLDIEQYLYERGYRDATASYTRDETPGELRITFTIARGPRYTIEGITVTGNTALSREEIGELLQLRRGDPFVRAALAGRAAGIRNVYRARGYTRARIEAAEAVLPSDPGASTRRVEVTVAVDEGPRTLVRSVTFDGHTVLTDDELRLLAGATPGAVFSQGTVVLGRDRLELEYRNRGYESVTVVASVTADESETQADIRYTIAEGSQSIIDHIIIIGNDRTRTDTIRTELLFEEGDPLGYSAIINSRARLAALGLFRRVDIQPLQHGGDSRRDVLIQVEEADPTTIGFGGGVEASFRTRPGEGGFAEEQFEVAPRGFFEVGRRNLWGKNRSVNLFTRVSLRSTDVLVRENGELLEDRTESNPGFNEYRVLGTFREPRLLGSPAELLVTGIVEQAVRTTFNFSRRIVRAETGRRLTQGFGATGRYSFERTQLFDEIFTDEEKPRIDRFFPQVRLSKFAGSLIRDTRDEPLDASRGTFIITDAELAGRAIGSEVGFLKMFTQASTYYRLPLRRRTVLALSARIGAARAFEREGPLGEAPVEELPASERFFAGGDTSVRGFSLDRLGNDDTISEAGFPLGGNSVIVLNGELRVRIAGALQGVGFVDAGNVFLRASDLDLTNLRPAAGAGIRYQSPVGPIRLDWGFNLKRRELSPGTLERGSVFHISLGQAF